MSQIEPEWKAKRLDGLGWIEGEKHSSKDGKRVHIHKIGEMVRSYNVDPATLCRNTTGKMLDGQMIWEGDLFESEKMKYKVTWDKSMYCWYAEALTWTPNWGVSNESLGHLIISRLPRIGNVIDNPELWKGKK